MPDESTQACSLHAWALKKRGLPQHHVSNPSLDCWKILTEQSALMMLNAHFISVSCC